jgi:hypothetical protein
MISKSRTGPIPALLICVALAVPIACNPQTATKEKESENHEVVQEPDAESAPESEPAPETEDGLEAGVVREVAILPVMNEDDDDFAGYTRDALRQYFLDKGATLTPDEKINEAIESNMPENRKLTTAEKVDLVKGYCPRADLLVVVTIKDIDRVSKKLGLEKRNKVELHGELWTRTGDDAIFSDTKSAENKEKSIAGITTKDGRTEHSRQLAIQECIGMMYGDILQAYKLSGAGE